MLKWMIFDGELEAWFTGGIFQPCSSRFIILMRLNLDQSCESKGFAPAVRAAFDFRIADQIINGGENSMIYDSPIDVTEDDSLMFMPGFLELDTHIDWERGTLQGIVRHYELQGNRSLPDELFVESALEKHDLSLRFSGLSFNYESIELLQPTVGLGQVTPYTAARIGRPPKWDWEGALAHIAALAQHPDGLPTGPGAQAKVEQLIADWFMNASGNAPAVSQVRPRAQAIMQSIEKARK